MLIRAAPEQGVLHPQDQPALADVAEEPKIVARQDKLVALGPEPLEVLPAVARDADQVAVLS